MNACDGTKELNNKQLINIYHNNILIAPKEIVFDHAIT